MAAVKALQQWCKIKCDGYRDVNITNMTTSFRDGLAFCALIHKHEPHLIDFDSLSKENVYDNNNLAFRVAETQLGIPALLDAEDMVALRVPDRLSILTYVSQYYNYFHGRSPIGGMAAIKRPADGSTEEPSGKKYQPVAAKPFPPRPAAEIRTPPTVTVTTPSKPSPRPIRAANEKKVVVESSRTGTLSSNCAACKRHVHLVQRHLVDGKLYHRNCFKCGECSNILLAGTYKPGSAPGTFVCTAHHNAPSGGLSHKNGSATPRFGPTWLVNDNDRSGSPRPSSALSTTSNSNASLKPITPASSKAYSSGNSNASLKPITLASSKASSPGNSNASLTTNTSASSKASSPANSTASLTPNTPASSKASSPVSARTQEARRKFFETTPTPPASPPASRWPSATAENAGKSRVLLRVEEQKDQDKEKAKALITKKLTEGNGNNNNTTYQSGLRPTDNRFANKLSPADTPSWKKGQGSPGVRRLKPAEPPLTQNAAKPTPGPVWGPVSLKTNSKESPRPPSTFSSNIKDLNTSESPADWRSKLKPAPIGVRTAESKDPPLSAEAKRAEPPPRPSASGPAHAQPKAPPTGFQNGKRSPSTNASQPEVKSPKAKPDFIPKEEIMKELQDIEKSLNELEKRGIDLEKQLRRSEEEGEEDTSADELMVDWFNLIRSKQTYMRRESELVYIAKTQDLEEQQPGVEEELRRLLEKPAHLKTSADERRERELMSKLVEIVNDRNAIVEGLDEDRLREKEEDQQMNQLMQDLDIKKNKKKSPMKKLFGWKS